jgi:tetratricopeptide (TPR) repeat protein
MRLSPRDPTLPYWHHFAARAELELGNHDKAIGYVQRSLTRNPGFPPARMVLAAAYAQLDNLSAAHRELEQLSQARPHFSREHLIKRYGEAGGLRESQLVLGLRRALAWTPLETPEPPGQFDGVWLVEFSNKFCTEKSRTGLWRIRQSVLKNRGDVGTVSSTGELRVAFPAFDPALMNRGSAKLEGDSGKGKWDGQGQCGGVLTLKRVPSR